MSLNENHVVLLPDWLLLHQQQHHKNSTEISGMVVVVVVLVRHEKEIVLTTGSNAMNDVAHHLQHSNSTCTPNFPMYLLRFFCFMSFTTSAAATDVLLLHNVHVLLIVNSLVVFTNFCSPMQWQNIIMYEINERKEGIWRERS